MSIEALVEAYEKWKKTPIGKIGEYENKKIEEK